MMHFLLAKILRIAAWLMLLGGTIVFLAGPKQLISEMDMGLAFDLLQLLIFMAAAVILLVKLPSKRRRQIVADSPAADSTRANTKARSSAKMPTPNMDNPSDQSSGSSNNRRANHVCWITDVAYRQDRFSDFVGWHSREMNANPDIMAKALAYSDCLNNINSGRPFSTSVFPERLVWDPWHQKPFVEVPPASYNGLLYLRDDVARIFQKFDLDATTLHRFPLFDSDMTTQIDADIFAVVPRTSFRTLELTPPLREVRYSEGERFMLPSERADLRQLRALPTAPRTVSLWTDPALMGAVFVGSD